MSPPRTTARVSTREVHENSVRALRGAGASAGQAAAAAEAVLEAEIQGWDGLRALLHEIQVLPTDVPAHGDVDGVSVVDHRSGRGPLSGGREVFDLATARAARNEPVRVFARGLGFHSALSFFALDHAERTRQTTVFAGIDETGALTCALACDALGRVRVPDDPADFTHNLPDSTVTLHSGAWIADAAPHHRDWRVVSTPEHRAARRAEALRSGLDVPDDLWTSVRHRARRFLIPEQAQQGHGDQ